MSVLSLKDCADANILKDIKERRKISYNKKLIKNTVSIIWKTILHLCSITKNSLHHFQKNLQKNILSIRVLVQ